MRWKRVEGCAVVFFLLVLISDWLWPTESMGGIALPPFFFGWFAFVVSVLMMGVVGGFSFVYRGVSRVFHFLVRKS